MYDHLDSLILARVRQGYHLASFIAVAEAYQEAKRLGSDGLEAIALTERRLCALQKRGLVNHDDGKGWTLAPAAKTLEQAQAEGQIGMDRAQGAVERRDPLFGEKVKAFFLELLNHVPGRCLKGEEMTDAAVKAGFKVKDGRAFGGIVGSMAKEGLIQAVNTYKRTKGHGTAGGIVWQLANVWPQREIA